MTKNLPLVPRFPRKIGVRRAVSGRPKIRRESVALTTWIRHCPANCIRVTTVEILQEHCRILLRFLGRPSAVCSLHISLADSYLLEKRREREFKTELNIPDKVSHVQIEYKCESADLDKCMENLKKLVTGIRNSYNGSIYLLAEGLPKAWFLRFMHEVGPLRSCICIATARQQGCVK